MSNLSASMPQTSVEPSWVTAMVLMNDAATSGE